MNLQNKYNNLFLRKINTISINSPINCHPQFPTVQAGHNYLSLILGNLAAGARATKIEKRLIAQNWRRKGGTNGDRDTGCIQKFQIRSAPPSPL
jgi:alkyl hydroperoxide reductase subunit AhpF